MTTRPFVPRATGEGSIGTSAKHWGNGYFDAIQVGDKDLTTLDTTGNAATATKLATARTIALSGDATGSATFDGSGDATIAAEVSKIGGTTISDFIKTLLDDGDGTRHAGGQRAELRRHRSGIADGQRLREIRQRPNS